MSKGMKVGLLAAVGLILIVVVYYSFVATGQRNPDTTTASTDATTASDATSTQTQQDPSITAGSTATDSSAGKSPGALDDWLNQTRQPAVVSGQDDDGSAGTTTAGTTTADQTPTGPSWLTGQSGSSTTADASAGSTGSTDDSTDVSAGTTSPAASTGGPATLTQLQGSGSTASGTTSGQSSAATTTPSWLSGTAPSAADAGSTAPRARPDIYDPFGTQSSPLRVQGSATSTTATGQRTYTVKPGDTLGQIAADVYGKSSLWRQIAQANPDVDPNALSVGHVLTLPELPESLTGQPPIPPGQSAKTAAGKIYIVQAGDSPTTIAEQLYGSARQVSLILQANPGIDPTRLKIGQQLIIPDPPVASSTTAPPAGDLLSHDPTRPGQMIHVVRSGDTLGGIARQVYGKAALWRRIAQANPQIDPGALQIGQRLVIPEPPEPPASDATAGANTTASVIEDPLDIGIDPAARKYVVREGDSLWTIADREYGDGTLWNVIYLANTTRMKNKDDLRIGQTLVIPPKPQPDTDTPAPPAP